MNKTQIQDSFAISYYFKYHIKNISCARKDSPMTKFQQWWSYES